MAFDLFRRSPAPAPTAAPTDTGTAAYKELCKKVRRIDEKAADYMEELLAAHVRGETSDVNFAPDSRLGGSFIWSETPQGGDYWRALDARLGDASSYPTAVRASAPAAAEKFPVGTRVRLCVEHYNDEGKGPSVGATGTVRREGLRGTVRGIRFDDAFRGGHRLGTLLPSEDHGHGWWVPIDKIEAVATDGTAAVEAAPAEEDVRIPLSELDGMEGSGAFVILATNRQEVLDPALLRDGRIDRKIMVERPNREVCGDILRACLNSVPGFEERFVDATLDEVYSPKRTYYIAETEDKGNVRITFGSSVSGAVITGIAQRIINEALQRDIKAGSTVATGICEKDIHAAVEAAWKETLSLDLIWLVEEVVGAVKISNLRTVHGRWLGIHGSESNKPKLEITVNHNLNDGSEDKF